MHGMICIMKNNGLNVSMVEIRADLSSVFMTKERFLIVKLTRGPLVLYRSPDC